MKIFVDANIFLRFLTEDDPRVAKRCESFFKETQKRGIGLVTNELTIAEVIWTLTSLYQFEKEEVIKAIFLLLQMENLVVEGKELLEEALNFYKRYSIDFIDAYNAVFMKRAGIEKVVSFDKDFEKLKFLKRIEP